MALELRFHRRTLLVGSVLRGTNAANLLRNTCLINFCSGLLVHGEELEETREERHARGVEGTRLLIQKQFCALLESAPISVSIRLDLLFRVGAEFHISPKEITMHES
jgi:hypothetical protein